MEIKRALALDTLSPLIDSNLVWALDNAGQCDQAIEWDTKALELDPNCMPALFDLGLSHVQKSMYKEATAHFEKAVMDSLNNPVLLVGLGYVYAEAHRGSEAQKVLNQLDEISKQRYVPSWFKAIIYVGLGRKDKAFEFLEKGYEERSVTLAMPWVSPISNPLRSDPCFADLLRRMNLQP